MQIILQRVLCLFVLIFLASGASGQIRVITPAAGDGTAGYSGDGGPATAARLNSPSDVAVDSAGDFYIADRNNNRIRKVDTGTGAVRLDRYAVAHDCGRVVNPMLVEGQIIGGTVQGMGGGLLERLPYDKDGQPLTGSLMDYLVPVASDVPDIAVVHLHSPSPLNPLGVKGAGEGGIAATGAALANAVSQALAALGVQVTELPLSPDRVRGWIRTRAPRG